MSDTLTVQDILDEAPEQEVVLTDVEQDDEPQPSVDDLIQSLIDASQDLVAIEDGVNSEVDGYEGGYAAFLSEWAKAREAGATEAQVRTAVQEAAKRAKTRALITAADAGQNIDALAYIVALDGDLPEPWVWRPAARSAVGILEGEQSVAALVRSVRAPGDKGDLTAEQRKALTGKPVVVGIIEGCVTKAEAIKALEGQRRLIVKTIADNKATESAPKTADKYAKAMVGPAEKISQALDQDLLDDPALVRDTLVQVKAYIDAALGHDALADAS